MLRICIILIQIRIQDVKKFVTDPDPGQTLIRIRIRIQAKMIRIRIQEKRNKYQDILICDKNAQISCFVCVNYLTITFLLIIRAN